MKVEVKKKQGESNESLVRRFTKRVQTSGILLGYKKNQYKEPQKSRNKVREDALRKTKVRSQKDYLRKTGQLDETEDRRGRRR